MKIPKYVMHLINQRIQYAQKLDKVCGELDSWLDKNKIDVETCDTHGGVEIYVNPTSSANRIVDAIIEKE